MRYFAELRYEGGAYCGWQRQPDAPTVQSTVEQALSILMRSPTCVVGAGRTDTGVNASYYVAHFDAAAPFDIHQILRKRNLLLPADIAIDSITPVADGAHARFDAREREYTYFITTQKNPFRRNSAWLCNIPLDVARMNEAAAVLTATDDFTSFAKLNSGNKTNICRVVSAVWHTEAHGVLRFTIRADRFLRNMVRAIVGTIVDVGRGRYTVEDFREIAESRDLSQSSGGAPPQGLFLSDIVYPEDIFARSGAHARPPETAGITL